MIIFENIQLALESILGNKMRSFLTMLGIIIGISSVIAITSIGASAKGAVSDEFESIGNNRLYIYPNYSYQEDYIKSEDMFTLDDIENLKIHFGDTISYITPYVSSTSPVRVGRTETKINLSGVAGNYDKFQSMNLIYGRMFSDSDVAGGRNRIVIEAAGALKLFGRENAIGEELSLVVDGNSQDYVITGIVKPKDSIFTSMFVSADQPLTGYVPYTTMPSSRYNFMYIDLFINEEMDPNEAAQKICSYLSKTRDKPNNDYYTFESSQAQESMINNVLGVLSLAIGAIAAISLVVGGIGIMNIMLVSVTERTREIGIRKSLGARTKDILMQFLIESMIISAIGGVIGTILGIATAAIGMTIAGVGVKIELPIIILAVVFSALVGIFFGLYPARKAAKLDPIEALRYE